MVIALINVVLDIRIVLFLNGEVTKNRGYYQEKREVNNELI